MKTISIFNNKGGVGKTTSAQNIGAGLVLFANQRILIIDADQQANLTLSFGIRLTNSQFNIANLSFRNPRWKKHALATIKPKLIFCHLLLK